MINNIPRSDISWSNCCLVSRYFRCQSLSGYIYQSKAYKAGIQNVLLMNERSSRRPMLSSPIRMESRSECWFTQNDLTDTSNFVEQMFKLFAKFLKTHHVFFLHVLDYLCNWKSNISWKNIKETTNFTSKYCCQS